MDTFIRQSSELQKRLRRFFATKLQILGRILNLLIGLIQLTEDEQKDAGIEIGDPRYKETLVR